MTNLYKASSIYKSSAVVGFWTLCSRIMGFIRDILFAAILGSGPIADAFILAFRIPNLFRKFFAEGAFSAAFIPLLTEKNEKYGLQSGVAFTSNIASLLLFIIIPLTILSEFFMPSIVNFIAPGFVHDVERLELAVPYASIVFPYLVFIIFTALFASALNTSGRFWSGAAAPVILNVFLIIALIMSIYLEKDAGIIMCWSVLLAGIAQMLLLAWANFKNGLSFSIFFPKIDEDLKIFFKKFIPGAIGSGVTQINLLVASIFASQIPGAISWLYYSDRVAQLPLGIIGIAIGTALLPNLAKRISLGENKEQNLIQEKAILLSLFFALPSAFALYYLSELVITSLFGYGVFIQSDVIATAKALKIYAIAIPAFMIIKVVSPNFFARKDTKTPVLVGTLCAFINIILTWYLMNKYGFIGIAISLSIAGYLNAILLFTIMITRNLYNCTKIFLVICLKILLSTIFMLFILFILDKIFFNNIGISFKFAEVFKLILFIFSGLISYFLFNYLLGVKKYFSSNSIGL
ncbi:MAG: murein biosynthesis integral membrane protein MurJ [Alphaproteobacteria bacterium]|nr:murein biosynthesis integral membrane protein MurJ [Alphaproteobacteria bacterium]